jgi:hypothetical protein
MTKITS